MSILNTIDWLLSPESSYPTYTKNQLIAHTAHIHKTTLSDVVDQINTYYLNDIITSEDLMKWLEPRLIEKYSFAKMKRETDESKSETQGLSPNSQAQEWHNIH
ncbi:hypothetical protein [Vibrio breoganii]|uniref:hypothetical protein n=1 Tax=Vibrio breoganii TaxID=553239 RepID=UPI000C814927|nr:hypothetical protein [Vibrio breoganii]PMM26367.1 hypothetical protein BCT59_02680 [Vibrio breoganii]